MKKKESPKMAKAKEAAAGKVYNKSMKHRKSESMGMKKSKKGC